MRSLPRRRSSLRLGAVSYLNTLPLIHFLRERPVLAPPAQLAHLLKTGQVDIATVPIVAFFENPHYSLVPEVCIGSAGPVRSVKLFFSNESFRIENVRSIALDAESKTSVLLLKVLLKFKYGRDLNEIRFSSQNAEGSLLIGDKAMGKGVSQMPSLDLGHEWTSWTGLPFVYAAWISRHSSVPEEVISTLQRTRDEGLSRLSEIVPQNHPLFEPALIEDYLCNLQYHLGPKEREGMELFRKYVHS